MNCTFFEKKLYNFIILKYLLEFQISLKKAQKNSVHWEKCQQRNIKRFVKYIYDIPFYRERFDAVGLTPKDIVTEKDFQKLPILTKDQYRQWIYETVAQNPKKYKHYNITSSSGSTGSPLKLYRFPQDVASDVANLFRGILMQNVGYRVFTDKIFSITSHGGHVKESFLQKLGFLRQKHITAAQEAEKLIEEFNQFAPDFAYGNTSAFQLMATYALAHNIKLHQPKCIGGISERLETSMRYNIEQAFGVPPFDMYGASETGNVAIEKPNMPGARLIWSDTHVVNVKSNDGTFVENGDGAIYITPLLHKSFPMVNYAVGDHVEIKTENGFKYLTNIYGRSNDIILNADGTFCTWMYINKITSDIEELMQYRVIQNECDSLILQLVANTPTPAVKSTVEDKLTKGLGEVFQKHPKKLVFEWKSELAPDPNGKTRMFISNIKKEEKHD